MATELQLELNLDAECRTTYDPSRLVVEAKKNNPQADNDDDVPLDYSSKTVLTSLAEGTCVDIFDDANDCKGDNSNKNSGVNDVVDNKEQRRQHILDDILFDCEITDCALLPRTFWMPCTGTKPRCTLERCALEVFHHHVQKGKVKYDASSSGAEWWVQIRPSPPAGRYKLLVEDSTKNPSNHKEKSKECMNTSTPSDEDENERNSICFHWDKDEDLRLMMDGKMYIHPHISTVTYLSGIGAPTMALNYRVNSFTGEYISPNEHNENVEGYISWPKKGKHLSFDGRYLHAAPCDFMPRELFQKQIQIPEEELTNGKSDNNNDSARQKRKVLERRYRRVTFLVNIWLNYKPFNVEMFPESMIDKLSKTDETNKATHVLFQNDEEHVEHENKQCETKEHTVSGELTSDAKSTYNEFQWSMGSCNDKNETISMDVPLDKIQQQIGGGNIKLSWEVQQGHCKGIKLCQDSEEPVKRQRIQ